MPKSIQATASTEANRATARMYEAHAYAAYLVTKYGDAYLPVFERLDRDVALARANENGIERARQTLAAYIRDGSFTPPDSRPERAQ